MSASAITSGRRISTHWMVASGAGGAVGLAGGAAVAAVVRPALTGVAGGILTVAIFGAIFGLVTGLAQAQGQTLAERANVPVVVWTLLSGVGGALGYVAGVKAATAISDPLSGNVLVYLSEGLGYMAFGAAAGLLIGLAQALVWRPSAVSPLEWIAASAAGMAVGELAAGASGELFTWFPIVPLRQVLFGALVGVALGVAHVALQPHIVSSEISHPDRSAA